MLDHQVLTPDSDRIPRLFFQVKINSELSQLLRGILDWMGSRPLGPRLFSSIG
jgi:hypothetical protein